MTVGSMQVAGASQVTSPTNDIFNRDFQGLGFEVTVVESDVGSRTLTTSVLVCN